MSQDTTARYPSSRIRAFVHSQRNLEEAVPLNEQAVNQDFFLEDRVSGNVDLIWRFNDDFLNEHSNAPALAFQKHEAEPEDEETVYRLVYIDPNLLSLWEREMDRR